MLVILGRTAFGYKPVENIFIFSHSCHTVKMMPRIRLGFILLALVPAPLVAQCQLCARDPHAVAGNAPRSKPIEIEVEASLDFSRVAQVGGQGGTVTVDPLTGVRSINGGLTDLGGGVLRGQVHVTGDPLRPIRVILPARISLSAADGSSVEVNNIRTNLPPNPALTRDGTLNFDFGGQLNIGRASGGNYHGRIPITVEYQ